MDLLDIVLIGVGLAMDAFAVSVCKGLTMSRQDWGKTLIIAGYFAVFQMLMPLLGYLVGMRFSEFVRSVDHWIAFILLGLIGGNMIRESFQEEEGKMTDDVSFRTMLPLAVATSIDALATGITFAFMRVDLWLSIGIIGLITFGMCTAGVPLGRAVGKKLEKRAELAGGIVLILIGTKILLEHLLGGG